MKTSWINAMRGLTLMVITMLTTTRIGAGTTIWSIMPMVR